MAEGPADDWRIDVSETNGAFLDTSPPCSVTKETAMRRIHREMPAVMQTSAASVDRSPEWHVHLSAPMKIVGMG
jgi:hypothetical protein